MLKPVLIDHIWHFAGDAKQISWVDGQAVVRHEIVEIPQTPETTSFLAFCLRTDYADMC